MMTRPYGRSTNRIQSDYTFWWLTPFGQGENDLAFAWVRPSLGILLSWTIRKQLHLRMFNLGAVEAKSGAGIYLHRDWFTRSSSRTEHEARMYLKRAWRLITPVTKPTRHAKRSTDVLTKP